MQKCPNPHTPTSDFLAPEVPRGRWFLGTGAALIGFRPADSLGVWRGWESNARVWGPGRPAAGFVLPALAPSRPSWMNGAYLLGGAGELGSGPVSVLRPKTREDPFSSTEVPNKWVC
jgi:hypothetical protein